MAMTYTTELTPREREEMEFTREENERNRAHDLEKARLTNQLAKIEQRWNQLFRVPIIILLLPIKLASVPVLFVAVLAKSEHVPSLVEFLRS